MPGPCVKRKITKKARFGGPHWPWRGESQGWKSPDHSVRNTWCLCPGAFSCNISFQLWLPRRSQGGVDYRTTPGLHPGWV